MDDEIIIVSGLPRSGTSLMMQMLAKGGVEVLTDNIRTADTDNPRGYYEFERVKKLKEDASWVPEARGKAVKMVSQLLLDLPRSESYRVIFMERRPRRDADLSGEDARAAEPRDGPPRGHQAGLRQAPRSASRLAGRAAPHQGPVRQVQRPRRSTPRNEARRVSDFLGGRADPQAMASAVDSSLYRNRKSDGS